jgi:hypothetical protein
MGTPAALPRKLVLDGVLNVAEPGLRQASIA